MRMYLLAFALVAMIGTSIQAPAAVAAGSCARGACASARPLRSGVVGLAQRVFRNRPARVERRRARRGRILRAVGSVLRARPLQRLRWRSRR